MLTVDDQTIHQGVAGSTSVGERPPDGRGRFDANLLMETALSFIAALVAIKCIEMNWALGIGWLLTPLVLIIAAFIPTLIRRRKFPEFGFKGRQLKKSLVILGWTCIALFPVTFCSLWVLKSCELGLPSPPVLPQGQGWVARLFYEFMYVAVAEEVFFRGYVQGNILLATSREMGKPARLQQWMSIVISAGCFAIAHTIVDGQIISALTFLPGLVLAWLFIRTNTLLAPILFHGLANACYLAMAVMFAR